MKFSIQKRYLLLTSIPLFLFSLFLLTFSFSSAQTLKCDTPDEKIACQNAYNQALAEQAAAQKQLDAAQGQSASLSQAIAVLTAKIKTAQANIKAKNILIQTLGNDIVQKQEKINDLESHIEKGKQTMASLLRRTNELDAYSLPEILLSQSTVTGFFTDLDSFSSLSQSLQVLAKSLDNQQQTTQDEKDALDARKAKETDARYVIQQQQNAIQADQKEQNKLLSISKGNEKAYSNLVAEKAATAAKIRAALFPLAGGGKSIPFGDAYQYALTASQKTGVKPALILAILTQESALGANVGKCYLTNSNGNGVNVTTNQTYSNLMSYPRDTVPFLNITSVLGYDPYKTVVSCPIAVAGGTGGGMGPAQFIASTWVGIKDELAALLGISDMPNPWNNAHAFIASGLLLSQNGASRGGYTAEKTAACRYYSGSSCGKSRDINNYGNSVMTLETKMQNLINQL